MKSAGRLSSESAGLGFAMADHARSGRGLLFEGGIAMATYVCQARSSYAKMKDPKGFEDFCERYGFELISRDTADGDKLYGFLIYDGGIPAEMELEPGKLVDPLDELAQLLADDWAIEIVEVGYENMRYLIGVSVIVLWNGQRFWYALSDAADAARATLAVPFHITPPEY